MDTNTNKPEQTNSPETSDRLISLAASINEKIDIINDSIKKKWLDGATTEEEKKNFEILGKETAEIINGTLPEEEILKKLEEAYQKIQKEKEKENKEDTDKKITPANENIPVPEKKEDAMETTPEKEDKKENEDDRTKITPPTENIPIQEKKEDPVVITTEQKEVKKEEGEDADKKTIPPTENIPVPEKKEDAAETTHDKEDKKENEEDPTKTTPEQEAEDIIHAAERGLPLFIAGRTTRVAGDLGVEILPTDDPGSVLEKLKNRLKNGPAPKFDIPVPLKVSGDKKEMPKMREDGGEKIAPLSELDVAMERRISLRELIAKEKQKSVPDAEELHTLEEELNRLEAWIPRKQKEARAEAEKPPVKKPEEISSAETPKTNAPEGTASAEEKKTQEKPTLSDIILQKLGG
ncbi:MAG: hypothetical protein WC878_00410 [Candidatus Paceibacterota bacterium]|jgi:hypothetical protein